MVNKELFFGLLQNELWGTALRVGNVSADDCAGVMKTAREQTVGGLVSSAFMRNNLNVGREVAMNVMFLSESVKRSNDKIEKALLKLAALLADNKIRYIVVKGQTLAAFYPNPRMRTPGDIDFFCPPEDIERTIVLLRNEWGVEIDKGESKQHYSFSYDGVEFELHFRLFHFSSDDNQRFFATLLANDKGSFVTLSNQQVCTLSPTLNIVYTFLHLYHHLIELGVGLRQFCDLAVLIHHFHAELNVTELGNILERLDFRKAFTAVGAVLTEYIGLPREEFPLPISEKDIRKSRYIMKIVMKRGNFGKYNRTTIVRSGMGYYIEQACIKASHYLHLYSLSPKENNAVLTTEIPGKIKMGLKDLIRRRR